MFQLFRYLFTTVEVISAVLLIGVILIQKSKSQGAGLAFGSGMGETLFGGQMGNVLTKTTVILAIIFLVNTALLAFVGTHRAMSAPPPAAGPAVPGDHAPGGGAMEPMGGMPSTEGAMSGGFVPDSGLPAGNGAVAPVLPPVEADVPPVTDK